MNVTFSKKFSFYSRVPRGLCLNTVHFLGLGFRIFENRSLYVFCPSILSHLPWKPFRPMFESLHNKSKTSIFMLKRQAVHNVFSISLYNLNIYRNHNLFKLENFYRGSHIRPPFILFQFNLFTTELMTSPYYVIITITSLLMSFLLMASLF